jgi:hypothetical protein
VEETTGGEDRSQRIHTEKERIGEKNIHRIGGEDRRGSEERKSMLKERKPPVLRTIY